MARKGAALALLLTSAFAAAADFDEAGFVRRGRMVFEAGFTQEQQEQAKQAIGRAMQNIEAFYGERTAELPDFYFCRSRECAIHLAGTEIRNFAIPKHGRHDTGKFWFPRPSIAIVETSRGSSDTVVARVLTHELSHIELHARANGGTIPAWFNEGLASHVAKQKCKPGLVGIDDLQTLVASADWQHYTRPSGGKLRETYCQAEEEVATWAEQNGGSAAVVKLLASVAKSDFKILYGPLRVVRKAANE